MIELNVLNDYVIPLETFMPTGDGFIPLETFMPSGGGFIPSGTKQVTITENGTTTENVYSYADAEITVNVSGGAIINNQDKTVSPSTSAQQVTYDSGYTGLGTVTVEAMPSGSEGTPVATKGAVSNHAVDVTPSVTNTEGYIVGGTKSGTAVNVSASELVSGTKSITANGTSDVTNYASVNVAVENSYTASDEGKVVSNGALVSQSSATYTANDTYDTTLIDEVTVNVSGSGGTILKWQSTATNQNIGDMKGIVDVYGIELDFNNFTQIIKAPNYFAFKNTTDGTLVLKNIPSGLTDSQKGLSDFLRQAPVFSEIDMGGLAPSWMTRWLYQWNYSPNNQFHSGTITIRNLCLDSLTGASSSFQAAQNQWYYRIADIYWTGELKNSVSITDWNMLNADSWNRLIEHLYDYSSGEAHTLTVGNTILGLIDSTHQALASSRGWTLA